MKMGRNWTKGHSQLEDPVRTSKNNSPLYPTQRFRRPPTKALSWEDSRIYSSYCRESIELKTAIPKLETGRPRPRQFCSPVKFRLLEGLSGQTVLREKRHPRATSPSKQRRFKRTKLPATKLENQLRGTSLARVSNLLRTTEILDQKNSNKNQRGKTSQIKIWLRKSLGKTQG